MPINNLPPVTIELARTLASYVIFNEWNRNNRELGGSQEDLAMHIMDSGQNRANWHNDGRSRLDISGLLVWIKSTQGSEFWIDLRNNGIPVHN